MIKKPTPLKVQSTSKPRQQQQQQQQQQQPIQPKQGLFTEKPSAKLTNIKTIDPFSDKSKQKTNSFAYVYNAGGIPCRINHGCNVMKLQWSAGISIEQLQYDPLLVTCFDGLIEEGHPYHFIASQAIKELLEHPDAQAKVIPLVNKLVWPLRTSLSSKSDKVFESSMLVLEQFSNTVGSHLNAHVKNLIVPLTKRIDKKNYREKINQVLRVLEENGGPDAYKTIKAAMPTYSNM
ncbi:hypothetical protein pb186bvf_020491 [Paramecium bursaria]